MCLKKSVIFVNNKILSDLNTKNLVLSSKYALHLYFEDIMVSVTYYENYVNRISELGDQNWAIFQCLLALNLII